MTMQFQAVTLDYGGCIGLDRIDPQIREKPVDPEAAIALRPLHDDLRLVRVRHRAPSARQAAMARARRRLTR